MPGGIWSASTFFATVGSATGIVYGASPGTSVITYSVGAGCTSTITVTVRPVPAIMTVMGWTFCTGGAGISVGLPGFVIGINYQLYLGGVPVGSPLAGTGSSLSFGLQTITGVYTVRAQILTQALPVEYDWWCYCYCIPIAYYWCKPLVYPYVAVVQQCLPEVEESAILGHQVQGLLQQQVQLLMLIRLYLCIQLPALIARV